MDRVSCNRVNLNRQHGAMEYSSPPCDLDEVRLYRLGRVRQALIERNLVGIILYDQINTRYATDVTNMQLWCLHNETRYVYVPAEGPVVLFDYGGKDFLSEGVPTIDEVRPANTFFYMSAGCEQATRAQKWALSMDALIRENNGGVKRIAIDRIAPLGVLELQRLGYTIVDGFEVMEHAREIKSAGEITLMRSSIALCEYAMQQMREQMRPGITENAMWSELHRACISGGGEWFETRLLASGPRTNPWFRECSMRTIERGDIVSFDTDFIGPYGYCCDISRSWICDANPSDEQKQLHSVACEQIEYNKALLEPGLSFYELSQKLWPLPHRYAKRRYGVAMHGVGMCDEYPSIYDPLDYPRVGFDGIFKVGMVMCVESLIGREDGRECVKLEEQVVITETGFEQLSSYPLNDL